MSLFVIVCFAVATILAFLAAFWNPPNPPSVHLLSLAIAFLCLAFLLQALPLGG